MCICISVQGGNLITNIDRKTFERLARSGSIKIEIADKDIGRLVETYADISVNEVCALFGSRERLEFAASAASAAEFLAVKRGELVVVHSGE